MSNDRWPRAGDRCAEAGCACHTDERKRVMTPFPVGYGPVYCCRICARCDGVELPEHVLLDRAGTPRLPGLEDA